MAEKRTHDDLEVTTRPEDSPGTKVKHPRRFQGLLHNDDYTTMEFVVEVLCGYFEKSIEEANRLMLQVHLQGVAIAGVYPREIAETKVAEVTEEARQREMPLLVTLEQE